MRLGLLTDIHEAVEPLIEAISICHAEGVDEILHLGDICGMHRRLPRTVEILHQAGMKGVWGNHDFGLCRHVDEKIRERFSPEVLAYMQTLQPHLIRQDCYFSHVEPWLDPEDLMQLWYFEGAPDTSEKLQKSFAAVPQRVMFCGHMHRWFLGTPDGPCEWDGKTPIRLRPPDRYLVILHALAVGRFAIYDTTTGDLTPYCLDHHVETLT